MADTMSNNSPFTPIPSAAAYPPLANYDDSSIEVAPAMIQLAAAVIGQNIQNIADALTQINNTLSDLALSWTGSSSALAAQYNDSWQSATTKVFGTQQDPGTGALNMLNNAVEQAVQVYTQTEENITSMFWKYADALADSGGIGGVNPVDQPYSGPVDPEMNGFHTTAVDETTLPGAAESTMEPT